MSGALDHLREARVDRRLLLGHGEDDVHLVLLRHLVDLRRAEEGRIKEKCSRSGLGLIGGVIIS